MFSAFHQGHGGKNTVVWEQPNSDDSNCTNVYWVHMADGKVKEVVVEIYDDFHEQSDGYYHPSAAELNEVHRLSLEYISNLN